MAIGESLLRIVGEALVEAFAYGITCWVGFITLKVLSLGQLRVAPLSTLHERNRGRRSDWSIWLDLPLRTRALKAGFACFVGVIILLIGVGIFSFFR